MQIQTINQGNSVVNDNENYIFTDIKYICKSTRLITDSLQKGFDVAQLSNGDIIITEIKTINTQYSWNKIKQRMIRISQK